MAEERGRAWQSGSVWQRGRAESIMLLQSKDSDKPLQEKQIYRSRPKKDPKIQTASKIKHQARYYIQYSTAVVLYEYVIRVYLVTYIRHQTGEVWSFVSGAVLYVVRVYLVAYNCHQTGEVWSFVSGWLAECRNNVPFPR